MPPPVQGTTGAKKTSSQKGDPFFIPSQQARDAQLSLQRHLMEDQRFIMTELLFQCIRTAPIGDINARTFAVQVEDSVHRVSLERNGGQFNSPWYNEKGITLCCLLNRNILTGRFSFTTQEYFSNPNINLDDVTSRDIADLFPELYYNLKSANGFLTEEEFISVSNDVRSQIQAMRETLLELTRRYRENRDNFVMPRVINRSCELGTLETINEVDYLYQRCYSNICVNGSLPETSVKVSDEDGSIYCFDPLDIIEEIIKMDESGEKHLLNQVTQKPFNDSVLNLLRKNFKIEIKMLRWFLDMKNGTLETDSASEEQVTPPSETQNSPSPDQASASKPPSPPSSDQTPASKSSSQTQKLIPPTTSEGASTSQPTSSRIIPPMSSNA